MGYVNVYCFTGGIPEWMHHNYPMTINERWEGFRFEKIAPKDLLQALERENIFVLDVRPEDFERDSSFLKGSVHCPLVHLHDRYSSLPRDRQIIITDWAMKQSPSAAKFLIDKGYKVSGILKGGLERWKEEGMPVEERKLEDDMLPDGRTVMTDKPS
jgi:rhodanese-related sulfurtransferase